MDQPLRIGFASIEDAASVSSWSGIPATVLGMLRETPNVEVELISPLGQRFKWIYGLPRLRADLAKEQFDWKRESGSLQHFALQIERAFRDRKLDVIFSTSSIPGTRLRREVPVVFWTDANVHAMQGYYRKDVSARSGRACLLQEEEALGSARFACYASDWAAAEARKLIDPERVKVLPFGPNLPITHTSDNVEGWIEERCRHLSKRCSLLFVGVEWERKGGAIAVETARRLRDAGISANLRVVGCTPPEPMPDFVELHGFIDKREPQGQQQMMQLYQSSDIFVLPSRAEAFGVVVAEAAAFGLPALVTHTGGLSETVQEGRTGFRLPLEDDGMLFAQRAAAVVWDYRRFARNAYLEFEQRLNWRTSVDALVQLLRKAAGRDGAA
ncbi:MAG TPA: glycosyltransferase family 4 protein [Terracidiphilus sp.]|nr:glycosyltransferase family 4 protein [Terracidiphilus sp.]